jgi:hypothetical protein
MKNVTVAILLLLFWGCQAPKGKPQKIKWERNFTLDLSFAPVYQLTYFAADSNCFVIADAIQNNVILFAINDSELNVVKSYQRKEADRLYNIALKNTNELLLYNDSLVFLSQTKPVNKPDSVSFFRMNSLYYPIVTDTFVFLENNYKPCLKYPVYCNEYQPEVAVNMKTGSVHVLPVTIPVKDIGATFMKADIYVARAIANGNHYYSFANSDKIFTYHTNTGILSSKSVRSKFQAADFFECASDDTSDYVSYLIQNQICSPIYTSLVYNKTKHLFFRIFNKEQPLYKPNYELNDLNSKSKYIQIIDEQLNLIEEIECPNEHFSHFLITYNNRLVFINVIINEYGKPILQLSCYSLV